MSFAPPTPSEPNNQGPLGPLGPQGPGGAPRSTPIPGTDNQMPGNWGAAPPPSPTDFVNGASGGPAMPPMPGMSTGPTMPTMPTMPGGPFSPPPRKRSIGGILFVAVLFIGPLIGIAIGAWAFLKSSDAVDDAQASVDSLLEQAEDALDDVTVPDVTIPPISLPSGSTIPGVDPATTLVVPPTPAPVNLFADGGAATVIGAFEAAISGEPSRFMQIILYPDYAFATAQDAAIPTHVDEYPWRNGVVGASSPVTLVGDGDLESNLFSATEVDWTFLARAVAEAPALTAVEEGVVSHIIVERSVFTADFSVVVRVYVSGPRGGGYVEYTPTGTMTQVVV